MTLPDHLPEDPGTTSGEVTSTEPGGSAPTSEPSFTRVPRPASGEPEANGPASWETSSSDWMSNDAGHKRPPMGLGLLPLGIAGGLGVWFWMRWQRERNKPINRLRRQARQAREGAIALRQRLPEMPVVPEEAKRPAVGLGTALLTLSVVLWQQGQARAREEAEAARLAASAVSDRDWQERLQQLKELWGPGRIALEKVSIPGRR